jgi:BirA family transcriptional regulator, biotin operon repressor / biotin---[acetyl-CoA-carboxylase] ligase
MTFAVGPRAAKAGHRVIEYDRLDSTNSEALRISREGERGPLWIVTREQTAGRGRRGREWISSPANLAASLLLTGTITAPIAATLGFAASLSACEACETLAPGVAFALKWPNDVLANGKKVAGILLESEARGDALAIIVGFGINLADAPDGMTFPATSIAAMDGTSTPQQAFARLSDCVARTLEIWQHGQGFSEIRKFWLERAKGIGQAVSIRVGDRVVNGIFETLDEQGRLLLRMPDGELQTISAGDVYFGSVASAGAKVSRDLA